MLSNKLKITFLGTGTSSGVPMIACNCEVCQSTDKKDTRLRSSIMVESETTRIIVDTGPDFRYQMLREKVREIDAVIFTHPHRDHIAGLDDIRAFNFFQKKTIPVYANQMTEDAIRRDFYYAFDHRNIPGLPQMNIVPITDDDFIIGDIKVTPIWVMHMNMPVLGFRFGNYTYITDANFINADSMAKIKGSSAITLNALRHEKHISHFTLSEAMDIVHNLAIPQAYFTHISHQLGLHQQVSAQLPEGIHLAYDGLSITVE